VSSLDASEQVESAHTACEGVLMTPPQLAARASANKATVAFGVGDMSTIQPRPAKNGNGPAYDVAPKSSPSPRKRN
jgi:hypothetical protein